MDLLKKIFTAEKYAVRAKQLLTSFKKWSSPNKNTYQNHFSSSAWRSLPAIQKMQHGLTQCEGCTVHHNLAQSLFPVNAIRLKSGRKNILKALNIQPRQPVKVTKTSIKSAVKGIFENFEKIFGIPLNKAAVTVPELNLQLRKSHAEKRKETREVKRKEKLNIENHWARRDCDALLGTRQSLSQRQKQRMMLSFETKEEAGQRTKKRKAEEELGTVKKKRHSPEPDRVDFDKEGLLDEVLQMKEGEQVIF